MRIYIASDHAGFELKNKLIPYIGSLGHEVVDMDAHEFDPNDDYPDFIAPCAEKVAAEWRAGSAGAPPSALGVILGASGQGEAMVANRQKGIRAAVFYGGNLELVRLAREHNDANILSLGARFVVEKEAKEAVELFLKTSFSKDERHIRRVAKF